MIGVYVPGLGIVGVGGRPGDIPYNPNEMLKYGARGDNVTSLQRLLQLLGYDPGTIDGIFGDKTKSAVRAFQTTAKIAVDGIVGPETWGALGQAYRGRAAVDTGPPWPPPAKKESLPWGKIIAIGAGAVAVAGGVAFAMRSKRHAATA